jgi:hypothetical protein
MVGCTPAFAASQPLHLTIGDEVVPAVPPSGARYLGLMFDSAATARTMATHRATCFASSFYATTSCMRAADGFPCAIPTFLKLLHTVIEPAGVYGSELWGPLSIPGLWGSTWSLADFYALADPLEVQRCSSIRQWLHLPPSTPSLPLLHELGCEPLVHHYVRRSVRFYNTLLDLEEGVVYRGVLKQNVDDAFASPAPAHNFVAALDKVLRLLLPRATGVSRAFREGQPLDADEIDQALTARYEAYIAECALVLEGLGSRIGLYFRDVARHALGVVPEHYALRLPHGILVRFLRFRLGCHHLRVHTGRWEHPVLRHSQRFCERCSTRVVDDEAHCLLSCQHAELVEARELLMATVPFDLSAIPTYKEFWNRFHARAHQLDTCRSVITFVATCVRLAWQFYKGMLPVAASSPPTWVAGPAGAYLDYFDSASESDEEELVELLAVAA